MRKQPSSEQAVSALLPAAAAKSGDRSQRDRIIDAIIDSCAEKTYGGTTIGDIVNRAHISRSTFYKHFEDKRGCFDAAIEHCLAQLQEAAARSHGTDDEPADSVRKSAAAMLGALAARPGLAQLLTGDAVAVEPLLIERYRKVTIPAIEDLWRKSGEGPAGHANPRLAFGRGQVLIFNQIAAGDADRLLDLLPEIVYLAVSPFGGHEEAIRQAQLARESAAEGAVLGDR
jgi:AcrR family transcriptional regulator